MSENVHSSPEGAAACIVRQNVINLAEKLLVAAVERDGLPSVNRAAEMVGKAEELARALHDGTVGEISFHIAAQRMAEEKAEREGSQALAILKSVVGSGGGPGFGAGGGGGETIQ